MQLLEGAVNDLFTEARYDLEDAREDAETVRFNESAKAAQDSVNKVLESYGALAQQLDEEERGKLQRSMGMKMEQLKEELKQLDTLHT
eukprot:jgi/Astpho2/2928/Aster-x0548